MISKLHPYYCTECKKILEDVEDLLFVEEGSSKGFCSEECIEDFYIPLMKYYEESIHNLRADHNIIENNVTTIDNDQMLVDEVSNFPDEIYRSTNDIKEEVFTYIKFHHQFYSIVLCTVFNETPAFILAYVKTKSKKMVDLFRVGEKIDVRVAPLNENKLMEDAQFIEELESKKSQLLGTILSERSSNDIPFEDFLKYDPFLNDTMDNPDEIFEEKDHFGDRLLYYLKTFVDHHFGIFFYIVICMKNKDANEEVLYPILSFPTNDYALYNQYRHGDKKLAVIKN